MRQPRLATREDIEQGVVSRLRTDARRVPALSPFVHASRKLTSRAGVQTALSEALTLYPHLLVFGEDVASVADPRAPGGHFHNGNGVAPLRDIPGLVLAIPARPAPVGSVVRYPCARRRPALAAPLPIDDLLTEPSVAPARRRSVPTNRRHWITTPTSRRPARWFRCTALILTVLRTTTRFWSD